MLLVDLGLAALLAVIGLWATATAFVPRVTWVALGFMLLAVLLRRLLPPTALGLAWLSTIAQLGAGLDVSFLQIGTVIVLYTSVSYGKRWLQYLGAASAIAGAVIAVFYLIPLYSWTWQYLPWQTGPYIARVIIFGLLSFTILGGTWLIGLGTRRVRRLASVQIAQAAAEDEARRSAALVALEREKADLARDVHDVVGHSLAVIIAQSDSIRFLDDSDPAALRRTVATIAETARRSLGEVRQVLTNIEAVDTNGIGVVPDLDQLLRNVASSGATLDSTITGKPIYLGPTAMDTAHRVLQEALTNALKFSDRSTAIVVNRRWSETSLDLMVRNHVTSEVRVAELSGGSGIPGMRARVDAIGGQFEIVVAPDGDRTLFTTAARIPLESGRTQPVPVGAIR